MSDIFQDKVGGLESPAREAYAVTPDDGANLAVFARSLYIGASGSLVVDMVGSGASVTFVNVPVGILPIRVKRVRATGTTAGSIVALV